MKNKSLKVGCVILNYNDSDTTKVLVQAVRKYKSIDRIVVVDNKSNDNSYSKLKKLEDSNVSVLQTDRNGGYGYGNNFGLKFLENENFTHVIIANPDIAFSEIVLNKMTNLFQLIDNLVAVSPISQDSSGNKTLEAAWKFNSFFSELIQTSKVLNRFIGHNSKYRKIDNLIDRYTEVDILPGSFVLFDMDKFRSVNYFDENVFLYCEERIIAKKFQERNYLSLLLNEHYEHNHSTSINKSIKSYYKRQKIWLKSRKYYLLKYKSRNRFESFCLHLFFIYILFELGLVSILKATVIKFNLE